MKKKVLDTGGYDNPNLVCSFEFPFGKHVVKSGDNIKIRNMRGVYRFYKIVHNPVKDVTWVDVMNVNTGQWHSFYVTQVKAVVRPKRSYRKKEST